MEVYFKELNVAELLEHDAFNEWQNLRVGSEITLKKGEDTDNGKIIVIRNDKTIGVLPKDESKDIKKFADAGWDLSELFACYLCRKDNGELNYDHKLHVLIKIKDKQGNTKE